MVSVSAWEEKMGYGLVKLSYDNAEAGVTPLHASCCHYQPSRHPGGFHWEAGFFIFFLTRGPRSYLGIRDKPREKERVHLFRFTAR